MMMSITLHTPSVICSFLTHCSAKSPKNIVSESEYTVATEHPDSVAAPLLTWQQLINSHTISQYYTQVLGVQFNYGGNSLQRPTQRLYD